MSFLASVFLSGREAATHGPSCTVEPLFVLVERFSSFRCYSEVILYRVYVNTRVLLVCPLLGGLSSFGVSFIRGFTAWYLS